MNKTTNYNSSQMLFDIVDELERARDNFPDQTVWVTLAVLTEEVGELNQAILQRHLQPYKGKTFHDVYKEAIQVAAMAIRVAIDCGEKDYKA